MGYMFRDAESGDLEQGNNALVSSFEMQRRREEEPGNPWQLVPPIISSARIPVVKPHLHLVPPVSQQETLVSHQFSPSTPEFPQAPQAAQGSQRAGVPLFRL